jgi:hypothetical protein
VQAAINFFYRNDVQAIDFLRKGSYAPGGHNFDICIGDKP